MWNKNFDDASIPSSWDNELQKGIDADDETLCIGGVYKVSTNYKDINSNSNDDGWKMAVKKELSSIEGTPRALSSLILKSETKRVLYIPLKRDVFLSSVEITLEKSW